MAALCRSLTSYGFYAVITRLYTFKSNDVIQFSNFK